jgi:2-iminobutanoate/2-iminopropanoate deaminase
MNAFKQQIHAPAAPTGRGPYPQALRTGPLVFVSGQGPLDPQENRPLGGTFAEQVRLTFDNVRAILGAAGLSLADVVKVTVYLSDLARVPEFNELYTAIIPEPWPARTLVQAGLRNIDVEVDVIAADPHHPLFSGR